MSTTDPSFSWGAETLSRAGGKPRPAPRTARAGSVLRARANALLFDGLLLVVPIVATDYLLSVVFPYHGFFWAETGASGATYTWGLPGVLVSCAISLSYFYLHEVRREQTPGKRRMGVRVRAASGGSASLNAISARTVLRLIDALPLFYLVGALVALCTGRDRRRTGDWVGGTVVVRDDAELGAPPARPGWLVAAYPAAWTATILVAIFALGLGNTAGEGQRAIALVKSYVQAREDGNASLACSMLAPDQARELVAIDTGDYATASASRCPQFILRADRDSNLANPVLPQLAAGPLVSEYGPLGSVLVHSPDYPNITLMAVQQDGGVKLDVRGLEKVSFVKGCTTAGAGKVGADVCLCIFEWMRAQDEFPVDPNQVSPGELGAAAQDGPRCKADPSAVPS